MTKKTPSKAKLRQFAMRMSDELYDYVKEIADAENRSMAYVIEGIIRRDKERRHGKLKEQD